MQNWELQLSTILNDTLKPMAFALFHNDNETDDYKLIYSNMDKYKDKEDWDLYSIPSLLRVLTLKNQIVSEECLERFYKEPANEICFVLEWGAKGRKVMVFNTERPKVFEQEMFIDAITSEQENLKKIFNRIVHS